MAGLLRGAYHFFHADQDAAAQANHYLQVVKIGPGDLPPVIDIEVTSNASNAAIVSGVKTWLEIVQQGTGLTPMIYSVASFWNAHLNDNFGNYPLWVAHYGVPSPKIPEGWTNWNLWQYSQSGTVNGIVGSVDMNYFNGTIDQLNQFANSGQTPQPNSTDTGTSDSPIPAVNATPTAGSNGGGGGGGYTYIVKAGDSLDGIAASFNVTAADLQQLNRIQNPNDLEVGQILTIPN
jgi:lysozyme